MASSSKDTLLSRSGGAYIPPMKLKMMMQQQIADKAGAGYQRLSWEALKKSIHGFVNKVNASNIAHVIHELFGENLIRGRGLLARSLIQCQTFSPTYTNVFAALVAVVNTKFPSLGELLLRRLIIAFRKGFKRRDKNLCLSSTRFVAHLVNQQVVHELLALEILMLLLEQPTDDSVEVAIAFLKECGARLKLVSPRGLVAITDRLRAILHEAQIDPRTQYMIEVMFAVIKDNFKDHPAIVPELDLVEEGDQYTHMVSLEDEVSEDRELDVFKFDKDFLDNEAKYEEIKREILGDEDEAEGGEGAEEEGDEEAEGEGAEEGDQAIIDNTEVNMVNLRRTIYLAIQSSLNFEEAAHKLLKMTLKPEQEQELCYMIIDCCAQLRTYEKFYGLLAERFCKINQKYVQPYERIFKEQYETCHRLELMKLRNVAKVFAHLLFTDAINWTVLSCINLTEETTTSSGRIFIKILFQELAEHMGVINLNNRFQDPTLKASFNGIFPTDSPKNIRFSINFFTAIGLGGLTDELRDVLKNQQKPTAQLQQKLDQLAVMNAPNNPPVLAVKQEKEEKLVKKEKKEKKESSKKHRKTRKSSPESEKSEEERPKRERKRSKNSENLPIEVKQERVSVERELPNAARRKSRSPPSLERSRPRRSRRSSSPARSPSASPPPQRKTRRSPSPRGRPSREEDRAAGRRGRKSPSPSPPRQSKAKRSPSPKGRPSRDDRRSRDSSSRSPPPQRKTKRSPSPIRVPQGRPRSQSPPIPQRKTRRSPSPPPKKEDRRARPSSRSPSPPLKKVDRKARPSSRSRSPAQRKGRRSRSRSRSQTPPLSPGRLSRTPEPKTPPAKMPSDSPSPPPQRVRRSPSPRRRQQDDRKARQKSVSSPPQKNARRSPSPPNRGRAQQKSPSRSVSPPRQRSARRSPSPAPRKRSPSPAPRKRSPSPAPRKRSPSPPPRKRSPSPPPRKRSPSPPPRKRSPSPASRKRSPSPPPRKRSPSPPPRKRSPSPPPRKRSPSPKARPSRDDRGRDLASSPVHKTRRSRSRSPRGREEASPLQRERRRSPVRPKEDRESREDERRRQGRPYEKESAASYPGQPKRPRRSPSSSSSSSSSSSETSSSDSEESSSTSGSSVSED